MRLKRQLIADFESRSVMLFSTVLTCTVLAASARVQAQVPAPVPAAAAVEAVAGDAQSKLRLSSAQVQQAFQHIDRNRDGRLSRAEVGIFPRVERHFERIDSNRDGSISPAEFEEALQQAS